MATAFSSFSSFSCPQINPINFSLLSQENIDTEISNVDIWDLCQLCALRLTECICFANTGNGNGNANSSTNTNSNSLNIGLEETPNTASYEYQLVSPPVTNANTFPFTWETYQKSYTPAPQLPSGAYWNQDFFAPAVEYGDATSSTASEINESVLPRWKKNGGDIGAVVNIEVVEIDEAASSRSSSSPEARANNPRNLKRTRVTVPRTPDGFPEVPSLPPLPLSPASQGPPLTIKNQKRQTLPQKRSSPQQPVRGRQAKLIQSLRQQVEELKEENEKLCVVLEEKLAKLGVKESGRGPGETGASRDSTPAQVRVDRDRAIGLVGVGVDLDWEMRYRGLSMS